MVQKYSTSWIVCFGDLCLMILMCDDVHDLFAPNFNTKSPTLCNLLQEYAHLLNGPLWFFVFVFGFKKCLCFNCACTLHLVDKPCYWEFGWLDILVQMHRIYAMDAFEENFMIFWHLMFQTIYAQYLQLFIKFKAFCQALSNLYYHIWTSDT